MIPFPASPAPAAAPPVRRPPLLLRPVVLVHILALQLPDDIERLEVALRQPDDLQQPLHADEMLCHDSRKRGDHEPRPVLLTSLCVRVPEDGSSSPPSCC